MWPLLTTELKQRVKKKECKVEIGDVILKVNETDVNRFSTKEVLKCLRLSSDPVTLRIKRDPKIKATLRKHLATSQGSGDDGDTAVVRNKISTALTKTTSHHIHNNTTGGELTSSTRTNGGGGGSLPENEPLLADHFEEQERLQWEPLAANESFRPKGPPKFEAYMMTGEHILNISRAPQQKKLAGGRVPHECRNNHAHLLRHNHHNSLPNSPKEADFGYHHQHEVNNRSATASPVSKPYAGSCATSVRTSRSEDQLQQKEGLSAVDIDVDDDLTSSLNTLLDTRTEEDSDRIVWTYNAPVDQRNGSSSGESSLRSSSPASPTTSVSSSVMSSQSGSMRMAYTLTNGPPATANGGDCSVSEAVSNISSPDYRDDDSMGMRDCVMEISDHSDSDSTLLVSEPRQRPSDGDHKIVIQVKGPEELRGRGRTGGRKEDGFRRFQEEHGDYDQQTSSENPPSPPPHYPEDDSDVESLHSFHYSPKAVDLPSAIRLAKRLYSLDGFKKSDVSRHLSKNNDFSRAVADEYLKYFDFSQDTLDIALRKFLKQFSLTGETQERERVLVHFSKRYLDCNPGSFNSQDAVHTLTCAIMLLNTDLHGQNLNRKMTCNEFIENLAGLNEGENFPREVLKQLYHAIKNPPLEWALDDDVEVTPSQQMEQLGTNPFLDMPFSTNAIEYKKGYVMRKCCYEANAKKTPFHKRNWKMFYCTLRDLVLYLHKDENGFRKNQMGDNLHNAIRIHHALATKATDYTKKQYVFRLQTADQAEYLFQTSDSKELQSWIDTINFVCASFSAPPLEAAVGSQKKFQRPLLPCSHTRLSLREQLRDHEERVARLETELDEHRKSPPEKGAKSLVIQNYKEKEAYLNYELKRFRAYAYILRTRMVHYAADMMPAGGQSLTEESEEGGVTFLEGGQAGGGVVPPPIPDRRSPPATNRYSYRQAIYNRSVLNNGNDASNVG